MENEFLAVIGFLMGLAVGVTGTLAAIGLGIWVIETKRTRK